MGKGTGIQWCDSTINPTMGCDGCELWSDERRTCYAGVLHRLWGAKNPGYAPTFDAVTEFPGRALAAATWTDLRGVRRTDKPWLDGMPRTIFVSDMGDSLSRNVSFEYLKQEVIDVAVTLAGSRHVWQWLTKRPARMAEFSAWLSEQGVVWPSNVWAGTSITDRPSCNRIKSLLRVGGKGTVRFLSVEPQVESLHLVPWLGRLDWIIQGGESGAGARPFDLDWARRMRAACSAARVPYFLKQLGAHITDRGARVRVLDPHGGDWSEWPADLRVREMPLVPRAAALPTRRPGGEVRATPRPATTRRRAS
jgi:protein gp37